jgi:hypothetical protein
MSKHPIAAGNEGPFAMLSEQGKLGGTLGKQLQLAGTRQIKGQPSGTILLDALEPGECFEHDFSDGLAPPEYGKRRFVVIDKGELHIIVQDPKGSIEAYQIFDSDTKIGEISESKTVIVISQECFTTDEHTHDKNRDFARHYGGTAQEASRKAILEGAGIPVDVLNPTRQFGQVSVKVDGHTVGDAVGQIKIDTTGLAASLKKAQRQINTFAIQAGKTAKAANKAHPSLATASGQNKSELVEVVVEAQQKRKAAELLAKATGMQFDEAMETLQLTDSLGHGFTNEQFKTINELRTEAGLKPLTVKQVLTLKKLTLKRLTEE